MKPNDYLAKVLKEQTFGSGDTELKELREHRNNIRARINAHFSESSPSTRWAGSMAKTTMIRESYDGDMTVYFSHDEEAAGETLEELYGNTSEALEEEFDVERKASALRIKDRSTKASMGFATDTHIDVVPGRFTDDTKGDVFLHRTTGDKVRLKTNLDTHISHIKGSGVVDAIRLAKLWNVRNGVGAKTFVLELLVVKLLKKKKSVSLATQMEHLWTEFRDSPESLAVEDPANPSGNDLKPALDEVRYRLSSVAGTTLSNIELLGWDSVFGAVEEDEDEGGSQAARVAAVAAVTTPTRPWCPGG